MWYSFGAGFMAALVMQTDQYLLMENDIASRERPVMRQRTRPVCSGCNPRVPWAGSLVRYASA